MHKDLNQMEYVEMVKIVKMLIDSRKITRKVAEITLDRIVLKYDLKPIYLW